MLLRGLENIKVSEFMLKEEFGLLITRGGHLKSPRGFRSFVFLLKDW
jgi:hypothetical protein